MKTWEMIKALSENPELKFKNNANSFVGVSKRLDHKIVWILENGREIEDFVIYRHGSICNNIDIEWEKVPQPVDIITAVNSGKRIKPNSNEPFFQADWNCYQNALWWFRELGGCRYCMAVNIFNGQWLIEEG
jgi:hypothetical protein